jgi:hypothetical protein
MLVVLERECVLRGMELEALLWTMFLGRVCGGYEFLLNECEWRVLLSGLAELFGNGFGRRCGLIVWDGLDVCAELFEVCESRGARFDGCGGLFPREGGCEANV